MIWTYPEFEARLQARTNALHRRDTRLMGWFGALLGLGLLSAAVVSTVSRRLALGGALAALLGLTSLAIYILASTRRYSRRHGVACSNCQTSLLEVADEVELLTEDGGPLPAVIRCPGCGWVVIAKST